jgi:hypothetical protein
MVQWTKIAPAQGIIPSYRVYWSTSTKPGSDYKDVPTSSSNLVQCEITGLTNDIIYYVWVKAIYGDLGTSDYSPATYARPIPPPDTPTGLSVTPGEQMLELRWQADAYNHTFTYEVYWKSGSISDDTPPADADMTTVSVTGTVIFKYTNAANITDLANGTQYTVWLRAVNTAGNSPAFAKESGTPAAATTKAAKPTNVSVTSGAKKLALTWDQVPGVPAYKLYYSTSNEYSGATVYQKSGADYLVPADSPKVSAEITGLTNGTPYYVWVVALNSTTNSQYDSDPSDDMKEPCEPAAKPAIQFNTSSFLLGTATAEYIFAQDVPASVFFPDGRPNTDRLPRVQEAALSNLFTDAVMWYVTEHYPEEEADFVFVNGGYIDNYLPAGNITVGGLSAVVESGSRSDKIAFVTLTGAQLKLFFQDVAYVVHTGRGGSGTGNFGQVSKEVRYTIQYLAPPAGTTAISSTDAEPYYHGYIKPGTLKLNGEDIVDNNTYRICTTDYNLSGVYFTRLASAGTDKQYKDTLFWHAVAEYIYDQGSVTPKLDGRIKLEGGVPLPAPWTAGTLTEPPYNYTAPGE